MTGAVSVTCIVMLPIRYQTAVGSSPLQAGLRLIPLAVAGPIATIIVAITVKNKRVPPLYAALVGAILQILGLVFISTAPSSDPGWTGIYGLEVLIGLGMGSCIGMVTMLTPFVVEKRDLGKYRGAIHSTTPLELQLTTWIAVASAAGVQFRFIGSAVVISLVTAVGNSWIRDELLGSLNLLQLAEIFRSTDTINDLPDQLESPVRTTFVQGFNLQMRVVLGFAVASVFTSLLMWQKVQIRVP
jgi:hypothetical protein